MEDDAPGRDLVKPTDVGVRRMQGIAGVVDELAVVVGEKGRAVEGQISEKAVGRRTLGGHRRRRTTPLVVFLRNPRTVAADVCRGLPGVVGELAEVGGESGRALTGANPRACILDSPWAVQAPQVAVVGAGARPDKSVARRG